MKRGKASSRPNITTAPRLRATAAPPPRPIQASVQPRRSERQDAPAPVDVLRSGLKDEAGVY